MKDKQALGMLPEWMVAREKRKELRLIEKMCGYSDIEKDFLNDNDSGTKSY